MGAAARRGGIRPRREHGHGGALRRTAQHPGSLQLDRARHPADHCRRHGAGGEQQPARPRVAGPLARPRARGDHRARRLWQAGDQGVRLRARADSRWRGSATNISGSRSRGTAWSTTPPRCSRSSSRPMRSPSSWWEERASTRAGSRHSGARRGPSLASSLRDTARRPADRRSSDATAPALRAVLLSAVSWPAVAALSSDSGGTEPDREVRIAALPTPGMRVSYRVQNRRAPSRGRVSGCSPNPRKPRAPRNGTPWT